MSIKFWSKNFQLDDLRMHISPTDPKFADGDWQLKATRPRAAGIDKQNSIPSYQARLVRMTTHDRAKCVGGRIGFQLIHVMNNMNLDAVDMKIQNVGNFFRPGSPVVIAPNGN